MPAITDESMKQMMSQSRNYSLVILRATVKRSEPGAEKIVWEHGRRNFELRAAGILSIVCPVRDESEINGVGIFNVTMDEVKKIMDEDPGVRAGIFTYEAHPCRGFPGDSLPIVPG